MPNRGIGVVQIDPAAVVGISPGEGEPIQDAAGIRRGEIADGTRIGRIDDRGLYDRPIRRIGAADRETLAVERDMFRIGSGGHGDGVTARRGIDGGADGGILAGHEAIDGPGRSGQQDAGQQEG